MLWATLAALGQKLKHIPPFLLVGVALAIGSLPSIRYVREWFVRPWLTVFGTVGIFGYHFLLFIAFRNAPSVEANLINYLWPILIVLFSALCLKGHQLKFRHISGAAIACLGAGLIITNGSLSFKPQYAFGYLCALLAAIVWAAYSVLSKRLGGFSTHSVGGFCFVSAVLSLLCHLGFESHTSVSAADFMYLIALGIGPMGLAFYSWDVSLKLGDPRLIGALSYFTPLASTLLLTLTQPVVYDRWVIGIALALIVGGAILSTWADLTR